MYSGVPSDTEVPLPLDERVGDVLYLAAFPECCLTSPTFAVRDGVVPCSRYSIWHTSLLLLGKLGPSH